MKSPHVQVSEQEAVAHRLITPAVRIFSASVILIMGLGIASIFWKMPNGGEIYHALFHEDVLDENLVATPLPCESLALLSPEKRALIDLPAFEIAPLTGGGTDKIAQRYEPPTVSTIHSPDQEETISPVISPVAAETVEEEEPVTPQKFTPMRQVAENPISLEPGDRDFQPKPTSVCTTEKSDELSMRFQFAENLRTTVDDSTEPELPSDPFPNESAPTASVPMSTLQPLTPIHFAIR